jgi:pentatricopeptide repeat protein
MRVAPPTIFTYGILMNCCCRTRRPELGLAFFGRLLRTGLKSNETITSTLLKCLCYAKRTDEAVNLLRMIAKEGGDCSPGVVAYSTVIHGFFKEGEIGKACNLFHEMTQQGVVPDVFTYSSIIDALCKARAMDKAELVLRQMIGNGVEPNVVTYNGMINGYSTLGKWKEATKMFRQMTSRGLVPSIFYLELIHGLPLQAWE